MLQYTLRLEGISLNFKSGNKFSWDSLYTVYEEFKLMTSQMAAVPQGLFAIYGRSPYIGLLTEEFSNF